MLLFSYTLIHVFCQYLHGHADSFTNYQKREGQIPHLATLYTMLRPSYYHWAINKMTLNGPLNPKNLVFMQLFRRSLCLPWKTPLFIYGLEMRIKSHKVGRKKPEPSQRWLKGCQMVSKWRHRGRHIHRSIHAIGRPEEARTRQKGCKSIAKIRGIIFATERI